MTKTVFYARVSTAEQTIEHQADQAATAGFVLDHVVSDHGVSGVSTKLQDRPGGRRLFDMLREGDVLVVRWVDRLGRNYADVTDAVREFLRRGVTVKTIINAMVFDAGAKDPMSKAVRDSLLGFMAAMGEAQAEATREAQRVGIAHAKAQDAQSAYLGRKPSFSRQDLATVDAMLVAGERVTAIAKATGLTRQTVYRIRDHRAEAERALMAWGERAA